MPADYVARANAHGAASYDAWTRARPANDFAAMVPYLEKTLELSREYSEFFAPYGHIADPHIDRADEGMTTASVRAVFDELRRELVPLVRTICDQPAADDSCLRQVFPKQAQFDFGLKRRRAHGLRHAARAARSHASSVLHHVRTRRRAHHHAGERARSRRCAVLDAARGGPRDVRAGRRARRSKARRSVTALRPACTRASRGCGRTSSRAARASGGTSIRSCRRSSPSSSAACRSRRSIAPSTRCRARSSAPMPTR